MRWSVSGRKSPRRYEPHTIGNARHTVVGLWLSAAMLLPLHPGEALWGAHRVTQGCHQGSMQPIVMDQLYVLQEQCWPSHLLEASLCLYVAWLSRGSCCPNIAHDDAD